MYLFARTKFYFARTFNVLIRNNLHVIVNDIHLHQGHVDFQGYPWSWSNFFVISLHLSDAFHRSPFFFHYITLLYDDDRWCFVSVLLPLRYCLRAPSIICPVLCYVSGCLFSCGFSLAPMLWTMCLSQTRK